MGIKARRAPADPMTSVLATFRDRERTSFADAWVGIEPTFQSEKSVRKWGEMSGDPAHEDAYFVDPYMLRTQKDVARRIAKRYAERRAAGDPNCVFAAVERSSELDPWQVTRQKLEFRWRDRELESFEARVTLDPETFEYSIKPVPLVWLYDERFVGFLEDFLWRAPRKAGLTPSVAHGGGQFSFSAKTFLTGSLLSDDIAYRLNHPELSCWIMDWPNPDDRAFRATRPRFSAFRRTLEQYWAGAFHPRALGVRTAEHCLLDRGFDAAVAPPRGLMHSDRGPTGSARDVFATNFAFGRAIRLHAQTVHPGYWQAAHPKSDGYRPDQIGRYSEGNLNRLQIAGEHHVKSGNVLDEARVPELERAIEPAMLTEEASWEDRGQMGRTSARDFVEALLLDAHHAQYLAAHPHVKVLDSLRQDQLLGDGERTVGTHAGANALTALRKKARAVNLELSNGRVRSDWIEPETLLWAAWHALPAGERARIAQEIVTAFVERVENAASMDPRRRGEAPASELGDPMEWHRHRIHPVLWKALHRSLPDLRSSGVVRRELAAWKLHRADYLGRRPVFSQLRHGVPPWESTRR